jgi:hypothetical protein
MPTLTAPLEEARENLRVIRQTMERSTKYSTLSGLSGVLIGLVAIVGVVISRSIFAVHGAVVDRNSEHEQLWQIGAVWTAVLVIAVAIEFLANKRRAAGIGKHVVSQLGAHIVLAALPGFLAAAVLTTFFVMHGLLFSIWGVWMLCYGLAICAVGLFSVKPVSALGAAFVLAGAVTLLLPPAAQLPMMAVTFGGFHIGYGILMARRHGW